MGTDGTASPAADDLPHLYARAAGAVSRHMERHASISPTEQAELVAAELPPPLAHWLLRRLATLGWLRPDARVPFDILDSPRCPRDMRDGRRELVRLALFGAGGQGRPEEAKHREALYQRMCSEILRETRDVQSLVNVSARCLNNPEVHRDPQLLGMLRAFVAERQAELAIAAREKAEEEGLQAPAERRADTVTADDPSVAQIRDALNRLIQTFDDHAAHFDTPHCETVCAQIAALGERYPDAIPADVLARYAERLKHIRRRRGSFETQVAELAERAVRAARSGDHDVAAQALRRLSSIHAHQPTLLPDTRFAQIRDLITHGGEEHEHRQAARELVARERAVAAEIKKLAHIVHAFHSVARRVPHDSDEYQRAAAEYRDAVREIRSHDVEWLADLILDLDEFVHEVHDQTHRADAQVDHFVEQVRAALTNLRREIKAIAAEQRVGRRDT